MRRVRGFCAYIRDLTICIVALAATVLGLYLVGTASLTR